MFQIQQKRRSHLHSSFTLLALIYYATVRRVRTGHSNALVGLLLNMLQTVIFVGAFYLMFDVLGLRRSAVRGDFVLYLMSGIFLFLTHTKSMSAVVGSEGPASAMMQHAPMNTAISITAAALGALYQQLLSMFCVLTIYYVAITPFTVDQPVAALGTVLLAWFSGVAVGLVFLALKPWLPNFVGMASTIYARANMITSGKMFLANTMPSSVLAFFTWNPLFHCIDQARGYTFINYNPHYSSIGYAVYLSIGLIMIGLMGEFYTRKHASQSWEARR